MPLNWMTFMSTEEIYMYTLATYQFFESALITVFTAVTVISGFIYYFGYSIMFTCH